MSHLIDVSGGMVLLKTMTAIRTRHAHAWDKEHALRYPWFVGYFSYAPGGPNAQINFLYSLREGSFYLGAASLTLNYALFESLDDALLFKLRFS